MNKVVLMLILIPLAGIMGACARSNVRTFSSDNKGSDETPMADQPLDIKPQIMDSKPMGIVLKATVFKMNGDYANNVAVTLDSKGNLIYFPDPRDLNAESAPKAIGEGWYLNRQGLGANSVFTKYTFEEYANLANVPAPAKIIAAIIPNAKVTEYRQLPISASEANQKSAPELLKYLK